MFRRVCALVCVLSMVALAQPVTAPTLSADEKKKLDEGGVLIRELRPTDNKGVSAESLGVVDAPSTEVWPVVRDCEHFAAFLPSTKTSRRTLEAGDTICFDEISMPFPLANLWADTRTVAREEPAGSFHRDWFFVRGTYRHNRGSWTVIPWGEGGKKSLVIYMIDSDPAILIPDAIIRAAQTGSLPKVFTALRERVLKLRATTK